MRFGHEDPVSFLNMFSVFVARLKEHGTSQHRVRSLAHTPWQIKTQTYTSRFSANARHGMNQQVRMQNMLDPDAKNYGSH